MIPFNRKVSTQQSEDLIWRQFDRVLIIIISFFSLYVRMRRNVGRSTVGQHITVITIRLKHEGTLEKKMPSTHIILLIFGIIVFEIIQICSAPNTNEQNNKWKNRNWMNTFSVLTHHRTRHEWTIFSDISPIYSILGWPWIFHPPTHHTYGTNTFSRALLNKLSSYSFLRIDDI